MFIKATAILKYGYSSLYEAVKSLKLITDPSSEGSPYLSDRPGDATIDFSSPFKGYAMTRRRVMFKV